MSERTKGLRVVAVAVRLPNGLVFTMEAPARHHNVIHAMTELEIDTMREEVTQGFLLSDGTFCRRKPARRIAEEANQLLPRESKLSELYSEDVW